MGDLEGEVGMAALKSIENLEKDADHITEISGGNDYAATRRVIGHHCSQINSEIDLHYVKLPVDKKGMPIRAGDTLEVADNTPDDPCAPFVVRYVAYDGYRWAVETEYTEYPSFYPNFNNLVHRMPPTIEDVLHELCTKAFHSRDMNSHTSYKDVIAEYAKKLRLAEGEAK